MKPLVSIITVSYNSEKTIEDTIKSVLNQTYPRIEYIIVDGYSQDNTVSIANSYRKDFESKGYIYTVISEQDKGIYDAMNKGIRTAQGEIVGIINSDDWYELVAVERMIDTYNKNEFDMFYADLRIIKKNSEIIKRSKIRKLVVSRDWNHPTTFITKKVYDKFQYKMESIHDDWDLILRIRKAGLRIVVLNEVLANFRMGGVSNERNIKNAFKRGRARYRIYRNNGFSRLYLFECILIECAKLVLS